MAETAMARRREDREWMIEQATLILKNEPAELERVLGFVSDLCARHGITPQTEFDLNLALDEIVTNVIRHAYPEGGEHQFTLQIEVSDEEFVARFEDDGIEFNPLEHPAPDLTVPLGERQEGGLGIFLARQVMTSVAYQRSAGKNLIILRKKLT